MANIPQPQDNGTHHQLITVYAPYSFTVFLHSKTPFERAPNFSIKSARKTGVAVQRVQINMNKKKRITRKLPVKQECPLKWMPVQKEFYCTSKRIGKEITFMSITTISPNCMNTTGMT